MFYPFEKLTAEKEQNHKWLFTVAPLASMDHKKTAFGERRDLQIDRKKGSSNKSGDIQNDVHVTSAKLTAGKNVTHIFQPQPGPRFYTARDSH